MFDLRDFYTGLIAVLVVCVGIFAATGIVRAIPDPTERDMARVIACLEEDNAVACSNEPIASLLAEQDGSAVMELLNQSLTAQQCHYIGHVVGQQSFNRLGSIEAAIQQCSRSCDSACIHGVIGEAFAQQLNIGTTGEESLDLGHLTKDQVREVGSTLCSAPEVCHGVGHSLFQIYGDFEPALEMCRDVTTDQMVPFCYGGMFMEFADVLYSRNMRPTYGIELPTSQTVATLCNLPSEEERLACFRYYPRMVVAALERDRIPQSQALVRLRELCREMPRRGDRIACIMGVGVYGSYSLIANPVRAVRQCDRFPTLQEQSACHIGQVSVATQDRQEKVMQYCGAVADDDVRRTCFQAVTYYLTRLGTTVDEIKNLCGDSIMCTEQIQRRLMPPWRTIEVTFTETDVRDILAE